MCKEFLKSKHTCSQALLPCWLGGWINSFRPLPPAKGLTLFSFTAAPGGPGMAGEVVGRLWI